MLVVDDHEAGNGTVSVRRRSGNETRGVALDDFVSKLAAEMAQHTKVLAEMLADTYAKLRPPFGG